MADPIAVKWICGQCRSVANRTTIENGTMLVPLCNKCRDKGRKNRCAEGVLEYEAGYGAEVTVLTRHQMREGHVQRDYVRNDLFRQLAAILDAMRVQSGGGTPIDNTCVLCEGRCAHGCDCTCHRAWAVRREYEAEKAA